MPAIAPVPIFDFNLIPAEPDWLPGGVPELPLEDEEDVDDPDAFPKVRDAKDELSELERGVAEVRAPDVPEPVTDEEELPTITPPPVVVLLLSPDAAAVGVPVGVWPAKNEMLSPVLPGNDA